MRLVEIRDLDGPNIFLLQPAIKLELEVAETDLSSDAIAALAASLEPLAPSDDERAAGAGGLGDLLLAACADLHERAGVEFPEMRWVEMEAPGHWSGLRMGAPPVWPRGSPAARGRGKWRGPRSPRGSGTPARSPGHRRPG